MLTDLSWLEPGKPFPPPAEKERLDRYKVNEQLFLSRHDEVWKQDFQELARKYRKKNLDVQTVINYHQLLSKKTADFVCGDAPTIETEGETDELVKTLNRQRFAAKLYEGIIDVSRYGNAVIKFVGKGISAVSPLCWFPVVHPADVKTVTQHVIAYPITQDTQLYVEIHSAGRVEQRTYGYAKDKNEIGPLAVAASVTSTGLKDFAVQVLSNLTTSSSIFGVDDYGIVNSLIEKIMWRLHCADSILDKHSEPSMSGPETALQYDERTGMYFVPLGNYFKRSGNDDPDLKYVTWDGNLDSNFKELEFLINQLYILTEMGQAFADAAGSEASSGTALKLRMVSPRIKAQRIVSINAAAVKNIVAMLAELNGIHLDYDTITIHWADGLPNDDVEQINMLTTATGGKAVMSQYAALKKRGLTDAEVKAEMEQMEQESMAALPVMDTGREEDMQDEGDGASGDGGDNKPAAGSEV